MESFYSPGLFHLLVAYRMEFLLRDFQSHDGPIFQPGTWLRHVKQLEVYLIQRSGVVAEMSPMVQDLLLMGQVPCLGEYAR